ncbi:hypothetical protein ACFX2A_011774 [Malus domestica]
MMHANLMNNYFDPNSVYTEEDFRRRFRMRRHVFKRLLCDVQQVNLYFRQKRTEQATLVSHLIRSFTKTSTSASQIKKI